jgi:uncharacterized protein YoaH (UPF0181 family)
MKGMIAGAVGTVVPYKGGQAKILRQLPTEWGGGMSTFCEAEIVGSKEIVSIHENTVKAVMAGTYVPEAEKVKGPRKLRTKKERAVDHVKDMLRKRMSRGQIIKELARVLRVSRGTAQTYYYAVK